ncbi:MAG: hypothetical protein SCH71_10335 [Desulfobulbaceae bacterium]|nr:hypothetical protein [Desulfobulbaceae bacterium]
MTSSETRHLSIDLWDTVLRRRCHPDEVKLYTAQRMLHLLNSLLVEHPPGIMELLARRRQIEADIGNRRKQEGFDDEYEIEEVLSLCILDAAEKPLEEDELKSFTEILVRGEIEQEIAVTYLDDEVLSLLESYNFDKLHIISDFYMSAEKVRTILQAHSFPHPVDSYFLSCDIKLNKRSGRLFQYVCSTLCIKPDALLHIGDNLQVDFEMAVKVGMQARHFTGTHGHAVRERNQDFFTRRNEVYKRADKLLLNRKSISADFTEQGDRKERLRSFGRYMSPLFTGFCLYIQEMCCRDGHRTAFFFTREGRYFKEVFDQVQIYRLFDMNPVESRLLPVSRLASFFPSLQEVTLQEMMRLWSQYHTQSVKSFLESLGLKPENYISQIRESGVDPEEMISSPWQDERFRRLFAHGSFLDSLRKEHGIRKKNLLAFFQDFGFGDEGKALVVDIGWRGTIQDNLALIFPDVAIDGCYLGLQKFFNSQPANARKFAYIADENRGDNHIILKHVMPLEMLCFSSGGSAIGYLPESSGKVGAKFQYDAMEERFYNEWIHYFQEGVLDGVDRVCRSVAQHGISIEELQTEARVLAAHFITNPPMIMCRAFNAFKQDDTFGMARTIFPKNSTFRLSDRLLTYISKERRERLLADLERSGWPQCLLRSRYYGLFYRLRKLKKLMK